MKTKKIIFNKNIIEKNIYLKLFFFISFIVLYLPIIILVIFSFNDSKRNIIWKGFSTKYYDKLWDNTSLHEATINSFTIASISTFISLILGFFVAYSLYTYKFQFKTTYNSFINIPIIIPDICLGIAMMAFFNLINFPNNLIWPFNLLPIIISHIIFSFPFASIIIRARLENLNKEILNGAEDIGANYYQIIKDLIIPHLKPSLIAASLLCFTLSLDDFVITFFTSGPNTPTLPIKIYSMIRFSITPEINAASTILILVTIILVGSLIIYQNKSEENNG